MRFIDKGILSEDIKDYVTIMKLKVQHQGLNLVCMVCIKKLFCFGLNYGFFFRISNKYISSLYTLSTDFEFIKTDFVINVGHVDISLLKNA